MDDKFAMKIALLTDGIFPHVVGGMQKHSYFLAKHIAKNGIYVDLYHCLADVGPREEPVGFTDAERPYVRSITLNFPNLRYYPGHYLRASYLYSQRVLAHLKDHLDVDFIYVQGITGWALLSAKSQGLKAPPVGVNMHGLEMFQRDPTFKNQLEQRMFRPVARKNLRLADVVFSLGPKLTNIIESVGVPNEKIVEIPVGIESDWLNSEVSDPSTPRKLVFIGRYERRKGVEELYDVIKDLLLGHEKDLLPGHEFEFHFIGPIPDRLRIQSPQVKYWGLVKEPEKIRAVLAECDVLVCPSHSEGMPTVILEAMAMGLAVIASDVGAISELVSQDTGWLIQPGDRRDLERVLLSALAESDQALLQRKRAARSLIETRFTWDTVIQRTIAEIANIVYAKTPQAGID